MERRKEVSALLAVLIGGLVATSGWADCGPAESPCDGDVSQECTLRVLDPEGNPVAGGRIAVYRETEGPCAWMSGPWSRPVDPLEWVTDQRGNATISFSRSGNSDLFVDVKAEGYIFAGLRLTPDWMLAHAGDEKPPVIDVRLSRGEPAGGVVRDEKGSPVSGAVVWVNLKPFSQRQGVAAEAAPLDQFTLKTDQEGRWVCRVPGVEKTEEPERESLELEHCTDFLVTHRDFADRTVSWIHYRKESSETSKQKCPVEELRLFWGYELVSSPRFNTALAPGYRLEGRVVDENGNGIEGVRLSTDMPAARNPGRMTTQTDREGRFSFPNLPRKRFTLRASCEAWASSSCDANCEDGQAELQIVMEKARCVSLEVRDPDGNPLPAWISVKEYKGEALYSPDSEVREFLTLPPKESRDGTWKWESAPSTPVRYLIRAPGYCPVKKLLRPGEHCVLLKPQCVVQGRVVGATTKKPVTRFFVSRCGERDAEGVKMLGEGWADLFVNDDPDGRFSCVCALKPQHRESSLLPWPFNWTKKQEQETSFSLRVEADGYRPNRSAKIVQRPGVVEVVFEMEKDENLVGRVVDPDGHPIADAEVAIVGDGYPWVSLSTEHSGFVDLRWLSAKPFKIGDPAALYDDSWADEPSEDRSRFSPCLRQPRRAQTDRTGRFELYPCEDSYELVAVHESGYARISSEEFAPGGDIRLKKWATIEGRVEDPSRLPPRTQFGVCLTKHAYFGISNVVWTSQLVEADEKGRFRIDHVPPDRAALFRYTRTSRNRSLREELELRDLEGGETMQSSIKAADFGSGRFGSGNFIYAHEIRFGE